MLKKLNLIIISLLLINFVYSIDVDILNPTIGGEYPTYLNLDFSVNNDIKYCTYNLDGGEEIKSVSYPKLSLYGLIKPQSSFNLSGISAIQIMGNNLYVAGREAIFRFTISNPTSIAYVSQDSYYYNDNSNPSRIVCFSGTECVVAYYGDTHIQLYEVDLDHITWYDMVNPGYDLVGNSWMFTAIPSSNRINAFELSDEEAIQLDATYTGSGSPYYLGSVRGLTKDNAGDYLFYASPSDDAIGSAKIRYSDPNVYLTLEDIYNPGSSAMNGITDIFYYKNYLYASSDSAKSIVVLDATNVSDLTFAYSMESLDNSLAYSTQVAVYDDILFIDDEYNNEIDYYDASDPYSGMVYYGSTYTTDKAYSYDYISTLRDFIIDDYILYSVNDYLDEIGIFTIYRPKNITLTNLSLGWHNITLTCTGIDDSIGSDITGFNIYTTDGDADGINDSDDNCPDDYNPSQEDTDFLYVPYLEEDDHYWFLSYPHNVSDFKISDGGDACDVCSSVYDYTCLAYCGTDVEIWGHPDADFDGIGDSCDNCINTYNPNQNDDDGDLIGNSCDNCFLVSNYNQTNQDNDTFGDVCDICINNATHTDFNGDGFADCLPGNCNNSILDISIGETSIDYGGACGTCIDGVTNGNYTNNPEIYVDLGGRCGYCDDLILNGEEISIDYGGHCGTCLDKILSPLINETQIDYGGKCGYCDDAQIKEDDLIWETSDKTFPVVNNDLYCESGQSIIFGFLTFGVFIVILFIGFLLLSLSLVLLPYILFIIGFFKKKKEKRETFK